MIHTAKPADDIAPVSDMRTAILEIIANGKASPARDSARKQLGRKI
jgi:hypothetical protein